jgi:fatty-acid desaturase
LTIRPKKIISNILVSIPVIRKKLFFKLSLSLLSLLTVNTMIHQLFSHSPFSLKSKGSLDIVFKTVQFFFGLSCTKFHVQISDWTESFKQVHRHYVISHSDKILLNFSLGFCFNLYPTNVENLASS